MSDPCDRVLDSLLVFCRRLAELDAEVERLRVTRRKFGVCRRVDRLEGSRPIGVWVDEVADG